MPSPGPSGIATMPATCSSGAARIAAKRMFRAIELQQGLERAQARRIVGEHGQQLECRSKANAGAPYVRHAADPEGDRHVGDLLGLAEPARRADVGLND